MRKRALAGLFVLALVLGVGMRFYGLDWGLPYHFHSDERVMAFHTEKLRTAASVAEVVSEERRFFLYPPLLMYLQIGLVAAASLVHRFSHTDPSSLTLYYLLGQGPQEQAAHQAAQDLIHDMADGQACADDAYLVARKILSTIADLSPAEDRLPPP